MPARRSAAFKVGLLTLISLALLLGALLWLRGRGLSQGPQFAVSFQDVDGLKEGAPVQMMGIRVGFVDDVEAMAVGSRYAVRVVFTLQDPKIVVPKGSNLSIEQSGLIGEKFLEITPPQVRTATLGSTPVLTPGAPVRIRYQEGPLAVGEVLAVQPITGGQRVRYRITHPGATLPPDPRFLPAPTVKGRIGLLITPAETALAHRPAGDLWFTIEEPMRFKRFLEIQLASAEALRETNEKVNDLLSQDTIASLQRTAKNTERLTAQATEVLTTAKVLFQSTSEDLDRLVAVSDRLAENITSVSNNLNEVIGNPQLKADLLATVSTIRQSSDSLQKLVQDPALRDTLQATRDASRSAQEVLQDLKLTLDKTNAGERIERSLTLLESALGKLSTVLGTVQTLTTQEQGTLRLIIRDAQETTENLREFSDRINGRFGLLRVLF